jgi:hypothetical protein
VFFAYFYACFGKEQKYSLLLLLLFGASQADHRPREGAVVCFFCINIVNTTMKTSITVSNDVRQRLLTFRKHYKLNSCCEALEVMLNYMEVVGDDPTNPKFTAKAQLQEMGNRLNQVIAFIRVFERDKLKPVLNELEKLHRQVLEFVPSGESAATRRDLQKCATKKDLHAAISALVEFMESHKKPNL